MENMDTNLSIKLPSCGDDRCGHRYGKGYDVPRNPTGRKNPNGGKLHIHYFAAQSLGLPYTRRTRRDYFTG